MAPKMSKKRFAELEQMLITRKKEIEQDVRQQLGKVKAGGLNEALDPAESAEGDTQENLDFELIQMKSVTLDKIEDALTRLKAGDYGFCFECGDEIAEKRLRALPFAIHCRDCEDAKERSELHQRLPIRRPDG